MATDRQPRFHPLRLRRLASGLHESQQLLRLAKEIGHNTEAYGHTICSVLPICTAAYLPRLQINSPRRLTTSMRSNQWQQ